MNLSQASLRLLRESFDKVLPDAITVVTKFIVTDLDLGTGAIFDQSINFYFGALERPKDGYVMVDMTDGSFFPSNPIYLGVDKDGSREVIKLRYVGDVTLKEHENKSVPVIVGGIIDVYPYDFKYHTVLLTPDSGVLVNTDDRHYVINLAPALAKAMKEDVQVKTTTYVKDGLVCRNLLPSH